LCYNHAVIGNYMAIATVLTFALVRTSHSAAKLVYLASIPAFGIITVWSRSRAGVAGALGGLILYMLLSKVRPAAIIGTLCGVGAIYVIIHASPELQDRFVLSEGGKSVEEYSSGRVEGWFGVLGYLITNPYLLVTGVGLGNFSYLHDVGATNLAYGHNNYLHWLVECGVGGLVMALFVLNRLRLIYQQLRRGVDKYGREIGVAFSAVLFTLLWIACTEENFVPGGAMGRLSAYEAFLFGAVVALYRNAKFSAGGAGESHVHAFPLGSAERSVRV
jgi:O-antigen ligase